MGITNIFVDGSHRDRAKGYLAEQNSNRTPKRGVRRDTVAVAAAVSPSSRRALFSSHHIHQPRPPLLRTPPIPHPARAGHTQSAVVPRPKSPTVPLAKRLPFKLEILLVQLPPARRASKTALVILLFPVSLQIRPLNPIITAPAQRPIDLVPVPAAVRRVGVDVKLAGGKGRAARAAHEARFVVPPVQAAGGVLDGLLAHEDRRAARGAGAAVRRRALRPHEVLLLAAGAAAVAEAVAWWRDTPAGRRGAGACRCVGAAAGSRGAV